MFRNVKGFTHLDLRYNRIQSFPDSKLIGIFQEIDILGNPLDCTRVKFYIHSSIIQNQCTFESLHKNGTFKNGTFPESDNRKLVSELPVDTKGNYPSTPVVTIALSTTGAIGFCLFLGVSTGLCINNRKRKRKKRKKTPVVSIEMDPSEDRENEYSDSLSVTSSNISQQYQCLIGDSVTVGADVYPTPMDFGENCVDMEDITQGPLSSLCLSAVTTDPGQIMQQGLSPPQHIPTLPPPPPSLPRGGVRGGAISASQSLPQDPADGRTHTCHRPSRPPPPPPSLPSGADRGVGSATDPTLSLPTTNAPRTKGVKRPSYVVGGLKTHHKKRPYEPPVCKGGQKKRMLKPRFNRNKKRKTIS